MNVEVDLNKIVEIRIENGVQFAYWNGEKLPQQLKCVVTDEFDKPTYAEIKFFVKLANTNNDTDPQATNTQV